MMHRLSVCLLWAPLCLLVAGCGSALAPVDSGPASAEAGPGPDHPAVELSVGGGADDRRADASPSALVNTTSGPVQGTVGAGSRAFLGIPYAAPPTGARRFLPPAPPSPWTKPLDATAFGHICPQTDLGLPLPPGTEDEDCLTLNVWTPYPPPSAPAPVMVFIHGGGFVEGASTSPIYDGKNLVEQHGVVLVSFNYRLGPLGWLAHPLLGAGNYGLMDQQAALAWVKDNIAGFGGDPGNVTLFGESAGGVSVCTHLASPASKGLFHRAIMESGTCSKTAPSLADAESQGADLAKAVGCTVAADVPSCLRGKSTAELLGALPIKNGVIFGQGVSWAPVVEPSLLPDQPMSLVEAGTYNKVPVVLGTNQDEGTLFVIAAKLTQLTEGLYETLVKLIFYPKGAQVLALYPGSAYGSPSAAAADIITDAGFVCVIRQAARAFAKSGVPTYLYHFTRVPQSSPMPDLGCYHGAELPFVFDTPSPPWSAAEGALSEVMGGYWTRMAAAGDPNGGGAVSWPLYQQATDQHLTLDLTIAPGSALKQAACDFWDTAF